MAQGRPAVAGARSQRSLAGAAPAGRRDRLPAGARPQGGPRRAPRRAHAALGPQGRRPARWPATTAPRRAYAVLLDRARRAAPGAPAARRVLLLQDQDAVAAALGDADADVLMGRVSAAARAHRVGERRGLVPHRCGRNGAAPAAAGSRPRPVGRGVVLATARSGSRPAPRRARPAPAAAGRRARPPAEAPLDRDTLTPLRPGERPGSRPVARRGPRPAGAAAGQGRPAPSR